MGNKVSQAGRSMVEMMGYLMVMMSVIVAIGKIVSSAFNNHRYSTATLQLTELATSMVKAAALDVDYSFVIADVNGENKMKIIPPSLRRVGSKMYHVFGGEVKVGESDFEECLGVLDSNGICTGGTKKRVDQFSITYTGLNKKQCVELAMKNWQKNQYIDLYAIEINNKKGKKSWFWLAYGDADGSLIQLDGGECDNANITCAFPIKRSKLTGVGKDDGQCQESENSITWVFN